MAYTHISAAALPALMADDDQRGRMVALRVLAKDWAQVPAWVLKHRSPKPSPITDAISISNPYGDLLRAEAPPSCAQHNMFFGRSTIEDHRATVSAPR